jgi:hypothetical protein
VRVSTFVELLDSIGVEKDARRMRELDTMLALVGTVLVGIPFELEPVNGMGLS